ncbi:hypothetical protein GCM10023310_60530 [Paenibacillus vulneris]
MGIRTDIVILFFNDVAAEITNFQIIGSAEPCTPLIQVGLRVSNARICLLRNGFVIEERTPNLLRFVRIS